MIISAKSLFTKQYKNLPANAGDIRDAGPMPQLGKPLEEGVAAHSNILAWRIPWTEEPGGLQSIGSQRVTMEATQNTCA